MRAERFRISDGGKRRCGEACACARNAFSRKIEIGQVRSCVRGKGFVTLSDHRLGKNGVILPILVYFDAKLFGQVLLAAIVILKSQWSPL